jgi:ferrous iron transport protein B
LDKEKILQAKEQSLAHLQSIYGDEAETVIAGGRYGYISGLLKDVLKKPAVERLTLSDKVDRVLVNRWLGIPIFLAILYGVFQFTFVVSPFLMDWIDAGFGWLGGEAGNISGWSGSLLADGIIGGVGSVLIFVPPIFFLFFALAILEDCGYMARAAFVMDRVMHKVGLHGRSFIPMVIGFGCNIPGIMACRTIENPKDRTATIMVNSFMSCGARLPIYILFAAAFFTAHQGLVVFSMYLIGIIVAIIMALVFRKWILPGPSGHFVMELPPYRLPTLKGVLVHMWERGYLFLRKAGTIIFGVVVLIWLLDYTGALEPIGRAIAPIFAPCGFGQWQSTVGLVFGFLAKEVVVGTFGTIFAGAEELGGLGNVVGFELGWTSLTAFAFMVFCLLYVPCVASIGVIKGETNSWKWPIIAIVYPTAVAWIVATLIYQIGSLF